MKINMQIYSPFDGKVCIYIYIYIYLYIYIYIYIYIYSRYKWMTKALVNGNAMVDNDGWLDLTKKK